MIVTKELKTPSLLNRNMTDRLPGDLAKCKQIFGGSCKKYRTQDGGAWAVLTLQNSCRFGA